MLRFLEMSRSTYNSPFAKLCKEVFEARSEALDNIRFLSPLKPWFEKFNAEPDFKRIVGFVVML